MIIIRARACNPKTDGRAARINELTIELTRRRRIGQLQPTARNVYVSLSLSFSPRCAVRTHQHRIL